MAGCPTIKDLKDVMRIKDIDIATHWYDIGLELVDSINILKVIKANYRNDVNTCCSVMFEKWLETDPDASWSKLVTALNNVDMKTAATSINKLVEVTGLNSVDLSVTTKSQPLNMIYTTEQASVEFGILLREILKELKKNESENLELLKTVSSTLTVKEKSGVRMFSDNELEGIYACNNIDTLLVVKLRHCYRWDDHTMLRVIMSSLNAVKCLRLLHLFDIKVYSKMKLQQIHEHCLQESIKPPEGYHKMVAIVDDKIFSSITKEEYDELKQFISQHCGVELYVISPFSKASPFSSVVFEWFIPVNAVSYMMLIAKENINHFVAKTFVYLKIASTVIFDSRNNHEECKQLLAAAGSGDVAKLVTLVVNRYIHVDISDWEGRTPLHHGAQNGHKQIVAAMVNVGANINAVDWFGDTPLHVASQQGHAKVVQVLTMLGADVNIFNNHPLQDCLQERRTALHSATDSGHVSVVETLIRSEAKTSAVDNLERTALHLAAIGGHVSMVEMLITAGSEISVVDQGRRTALHLAAGGGHIAVIKQLLISGARINLPDENGDTPIHIASEEGHVGVVELLINYGANVYILKKDVQDRIEELMEVPRQRGMHHQYSVDDSSEFTSSTASSDYIDIDSLEWASIVGTTASDGQSKDQNKKEDDHYHKH